MSRRRQEWFTECVLACGVSVLRLFSASGPSGVGRRAPLVVYASTPGLWPVQSWASMIVTRAGGLAVNSSLPGFHTDGFLR